MRSILFPRQTIQESLDDLDTTYSGYLSFWIWFDLKRHFVRLKNISSAQDKNENVLKTVRKPNFFLDKLNQNLMTDVIDVLYKENICIWVLSIKENLFKIGNNDLLINPYENQFFS